MKYGYARSAQNEDALNVQKAMLESFGVDKDNIFADIGSGNQINPRLEMLLSMINKDDIVVVKSIDRIGRLSSVMQEVVNKVYNKGAEIEFIDGKSMDYIWLKTLLESKEGVGGEELAINQAFSGRS